MTLTVLAPVAGVVRALADVPDPVFAQHMVGPGVAVEPSGTQVVAPVSGVVVAVQPHAFVVRADGAVPRDVLVHVGIDTVGLRGAGFDVRVVEGERVMAGATVLVWDPAVVAAAGLSPVCPVVALQADAAQLRLLVAPGRTVALGVPLFDWA